MPSINCLYDAGFRSLQIAPASSEFVPASSDLCKRGLNGRVYGRCRSPLAVRHVFPGVVAGMAISVAGPRGAEIGLVVLGALIVASIVWHLLKKESRSIPLDSASVDPPAQQRSSQNKHSEVSRAPD